MLFLFDFTGLRCYFFEHKVKIESRCDLNQCCGCCLMTDFCKNLQNGEFILVTKQEIKRLYARIQECEMLIEMYKYELLKHQKNEINELKTHQSNFE